MKAHRSLLAFAFALSFPLSALAQESPEKNSEQDKEPQKTVEKKQPDRASPRALIQTFKAAYDDATLKDFLRSIEAVREKGSLKRLLVARECLELDLTSVDKDQRDSEAFRSVQSVADLLNYFYPVIDLKQDVPGEGEVSNKHWELRHTSLTEQMHLLQDDDGKWLFGSFTVKNARNAVLRLESWLQ